MKKLLLTLGSAAAVAAPLATVVACNEPDYTNLITMDYTGTPISEEIEGIIDGILVDEDGNALTDFTNVSISLDLDADSEAYYIMSFDDFSGVDMNYGTILLDIINMPEQTEDGTETEDAIAAIIAAVEMYLA